MAGGQREEIEALGPVDRNAQTQLARCWRLIRRRREQKSINEKITSRRAGGQSQLGSVAKPDAVSITSLGPIMVYAA